MLFLQSQLDTVDLGVLITVFLDHAAESLENVIYPNPNPNPNPNPDPNPNPNPNPNPKPNPNPNPKQR